MSVNPSDSPRPVPRRCRTEDGIVGLTLVAGDKERAEPISGPDHRHLRAVPPIRDGGKGVAPPPPPRDWATVADLVAFLDAAGHLDSAAVVTVPAHEVVNLYRKLQSQPVIEEAKGIVMGHYGLDADTAFRLLRRWSQDGNVKLRILAQALVGAVSQHCGSDISPHDLIYQMITTHTSAPADES